MTNLRFSILTGLCLLVSYSSAATAQESFGEGTHLVGSDIQPGIYRTNGEITYFERLSGLSGEFSDIIANEASPPTPVLVEIKEDDIAFKSEGSGVWTRIDGSYNPEIKTSFDDGWWIVGVDIQPGLYRTTDEVRYYARLSDVSGDFSAIIANEASTSGPAIIEINENDFAFQSSGDVLWSLIDDSYQPELRTSFGDGWWIVGVDIQPGVYRTPDDVSYYARLSGFGNEFSEIIANEASASGNSIIEIFPTDVGFQTQGGATWTIIDLSPTAVKSSTWGMIKLHGVEK
jgi:hypothetical protein